MLSAESISILPADALILTAAASFSVDVILTEEPVAVILISSPAAAPVAVISTPPAEAVNTTALAPFAAEAMFTPPEESRSTPPVPVLISNKTEFNSISVVALSKLPILTSIATSSLAIKISPPAAVFSSIFPLLVASICTPVWPSNIREPPDESSVKLPADTKLEVGASSPEVPPVPWVNFISCPAPSEKTPPSLVRFRPSPIFKLSLTSISPLLAKVNLGLSPKLLPTPIT